MARAWLRYQKKFRHYRKDKGGVEGVEPKKISDSKNTSAVATSEEELLFISELSCVNVANDESTWVINSGAHRFTWHPRQSASHLTEPEITETLR